MINLGPDYFPPVVRPFLIGLFILMGIAPLAAWRRSTAERLGRAVVVPLLLSLAVMLLLVATGTTGIWALLGFGLVAFAGFATLTEIWKGVAARHRGARTTGGFSTLVARDRGATAAISSIWGLLVLAWA